MATPSSSLAARQLRAAGLMTLLAAVGLLTVGVTAALQLHGTFSAGVAAMLIAYGGLVAIIGWSGWRRTTWSSGPIVAAAVLHLLVLIAIARQGSVWLWLLALPLVTTAVLAVWARIRLARQEGHAGA